jgi:hypothetical protein
VILDLPPNWRPRWRSELGDSGRGGLALPIGTSPDA